MYHLYILECSDGSLYTGIAKDLKKRLEAHQNGKGSKYVRSRLPFLLIYSEEYATKSEAMRREIEIKSMSRARKKAMIPCISGFCQTDR
ncbi:MAG: GIY-YIG nuclease family protein [Candidatus Aenigmarchaeota archaeon]|nr:GIY-YIG nuclease family protein [Candidatus Aenigmarchaeota archaeon]